MNTDKTKPKNCFWFYPCSSVFIGGLLASAVFFTVSHAIPQISMCWCALPGKMPAAADGRSRNSALAAWESRQRTWVRPAWWSSWG
jgi:hypothetical protein